MSSPSPLKCRVPLETLVHELQLEHAGLPTQFYLEGARKDSWLPPLRGSVSFQTLRLVEVMLAAAMGAFCVRWGLIGHTAFWVCAGVALVVMTVLQTRPVSFDDDGGEDTRRIKDDAADGAVAENLAALADRLELATHKGFSLNWVGSQTTVFFESCVIAVLTLAALATVFHGHAQHWLWIVGLVTAGVCIGVAEVCGHIALRNGIRAVREGRCVMCDYELDGLPEPGQEREGRPRRARVWTCSECGEPNVALSGG